ncbi:MAG: hypothetical protein JWN34_4045 [Bryobacterales bacterium]|nr:hypothetical protein [Bryobacterales bacterium]
MYLRVHLCFALYRSNAVWFHVWFIFCLCVAGCLTCYAIAKAKARWSFFGMLVIGLMIWAATNRQAPVGDSPTIYTSPEPDRTIYTGPRGGRYHYSGNGNKVYERHRKGSE